MANYYAKTTGTRSSGASTVDDWSDANCYSSAISGVGLADGDTIVFGAGNYTLSAEWSITKAVSVAKRGDGAVRLFRSGGGTLVTLNPDSAGTCAWDGVDIDCSIILFNGLRVAANAVVSSTVSISNVVIYGGVATLGFSSLKTRGILNLTNLTFSGTFVGNIATCVNSATDGAMTINVAGIVYAATCTYNSAYYGFSVVKANAANALTVNVSAVTGTLTSSDAGAGPYAVTVQGADTVVVESCNFEVNSTATGNSGYGIIVFGLDATNRKTNGHIVRNNTVRYYCPAGDGICNGLDAETGLGYTTNPLVYGNTIQGINSEAYTPHGLTFRGLASGRAYGNKMSRLHSPMMLSLCTSDNARMFSNTITGCYGVMVSLKGNSGGIMHNNTCIASALTTAVPYGIWAREQGAVANSASKAYNNSIVFDGVNKAYQFAFVDTGDACTFSNNNYYQASGSSHATPFAYTGATYANVAAWAAANETSALNNNPLHANLTDDFRLSAGSPLHRAGKYVDGNVDFRGRTRMVPPAIGAYEPSRGDPPIVVRT